MEPRIETITEKKLVGTHVRMSLVASAAGNYQQCKQRPDLHAGV